MKNSKISPKFIDLIAKLIRPSKSEISNNKADKINICFVNSTKSWGGGERWHFENALNLKKNGFNVSIIGSPDSALHEISKKNEVYFFSINLSGYSFLNPWKISKLTKFFQKEQIDIVVFNGPADLKTGGIAAYKANVKNRVYRRGLAKAPKHDLFNKFLFNYVVTDFMVNSKATEKLLFSSNLIEKKKTNVILLYNGLDKTECNSYEISQNQKIVLGNASRFVPQKGLHYLIELAAILKKQSDNFIIKIAGSGPLENELKELSKKLDVNDNIQFLGFVDNIKNFICNLDIYVCSSIFEGFGFSIAEAMYASKAVIGFDISSNPELIINNKTGFLVTPFDLNALAEKTLELMKNEEKRNDFGKNAYILASEKFNKNKQQLAFTKIIESLVKK